MLNFNRNDRPGDAKPTDKYGLRPAVSATPPSAGGTSAVGRGGGSAGAGTAPSSPAPSAAPLAPPSQVVHHEAPSEPAAAVQAVGTGGSRLIVGRNVKLKGVEISDCEMVVVEGQVEASVTSKGMQIAKPGVLKGTATIDVAEIDGDFTGELTVRTKLVVNGTGRVSGTIRYGSLIVAEGGEVTGDVKRIDSGEPPLLNAAVNETRKPGAGLHTN